MQLNTRFVPARRLLGLASALGAMAWLSAAGCSSHDGLQGGEAGKSGSAGSNGRGGSNGSGAAGHGGLGGEPSGAGGEGGGATGGDGVSGSFGTGGDGGDGEGGNGTGGTGGPSSGGGGAGSGGHAGAGSGGTGGTAGRSGGGGNGGTGANGGTTGMAGNPGVAGATQCSLTNHSGNGSFTYYYFGQGTAKDGSGYRTACGYYGTENGQTDTVQNIASMSPANATYFAAIPGHNGFDTKTNCGACVQITGQNGKQIIATVADECPYGNDGNNSACANNPNGHLDLSKAAFDQLGYNVGNPNGTNWKFVPCPVTGNVVFRVKPGNPNELFIENTVLAVTSVQGATKTSYGSWHFGGNLSAGQAITMTDSAGRMVTANLPGTSAGQNQDSGLQFPACH